ncbi:MAG: hypothetical protein ACXWCT_14300 [Flavitalea sp.]
MVKHTTLISFLIAFCLGLAGIFLFPYYTINPGVMIEDHMQLKNDCLSCHTIGTGAQMEKCIICHSLATIGIKSVDGINKEPYNSKSNLLHQSIINIQCYDCHTEHNGLSRENATLKFRHDVLSSDLQKECIKCHSPQKPDDDIHKILTVNCSECHSTEAWKPSHFKHDLLGERLNECRSCHENKKPADPLHKNFGNDIQCVQCHTTDKWKPSTFDHTKYFRFDGNHPSDCANCHDVNKTFETYTCYNCHEHNPSKIENEHLKEGIQNFSNCVDCHRSSDENEAEGRGKKKRGRDRDDN